MAFKGFNSILFDFDSIVDREVSLIKYFIGEYRENLFMADFMDLPKAIGMINDNFKFERLYGSDDLFRSLLFHESHKNAYEELINKFFERDQKEIYERGYAFNTTMPILISAYKKAGNGVIRTAVRCDNQYQLDYIKSIDRDIVAFISDRKSVDMGKYTRLIVGNWNSALEYTLEEPKSIVILNFRENFDKQDSTILNPELIINLGDINKIEIASAYREDEFISG